MGVHGLFEGIALGLRGDRPNLFSIFFAIICHKWSEALTVGISFVQADIPPNRSVLYLTFFSFITPIGIVIGMIIKSAFERLEGVAIALSAGTFLYISCGEIIIEEFSLAKNKYLKFLFFMIGAAVIIFLGRIV